MALRELNAVCNYCGARFRARPTRSFLGFQKLVCPQCSRKLLYPLTSGYRAIYWFIVGIMGLTIAGKLLVEGEVVLPGGLGIAGIIGGIIGLAKDGQIRKRVQITEIHASDAGSG